MESFHSFLFLHSWRFFSLIFAIDFCSERWSRHSIFPIFLLSWWRCLTGRVIRQLWKSEYCLLLSPNWFIREIIFAGVCIGTIHFIILKFWMSPMLNSFQSEGIGCWCIFIDMESDTMLYIVWKLLFCFPWNFKYFMDDFLLTVLWHCHVCWVKFCFNVGSRSVWKDWHIVSTLFSWNVPNAKYLSLHSLSLWIYCGKLLFSPWNFKYLLGDFLLTVLLSLLNWVVF